MHVYIGSQLDYGSIIVGAANNNQLQRLQIIQSKVLRACVRGMTSSPTEALYVEAPFRTLSSLFGHQILG